MNFLNLRWSNSFSFPLFGVLNGRIMNSNIGWKSSGKNSILKKNNMLNFKTIEPSTQIALLVNPKKHPNFPKTELDDAVDNAVSDFWKELEELENGEVHRSLSGPMWLHYIIHNIYFLFPSIPKYVFKFLQWLMMIGHDPKAHHPVFFSTFVSFRVLSPSKFTY